MTVSASVKHPENLLRIDRGYIVAWGRREAWLWLCYGVLLTASLATAAFRYSAFWALGFLVSVPLTALLILFFRNPRRQVPEEPGLLVSPADGTVTDIAEVDEPGFLRGPAVRIGIFLSIFSVHVNRAPASGRVERVEHRDGAHHDARKPACAAENESNCIGILREDSGGPDGVRLLVKQISGAIAKRIVCPLEPGMAVARGGLVGMIKYGSRTELYIPVDAGARIRVKIGEKVSGGATVLADFPQG